MRKAAFLTLMFSLSAVLAWPLTAYAVEDGLVGYWKLDEIVEPYWTDGQIGGALDLDNPTVAIGPYVNVPDDPALTDLPAMTATMWVKPDVLVWGTNFIGKGNNGCGTVSLFTGWQLCRDPFGSPTNGALWFRVKFDGGSNLHVNTSSAPLALGVWNHLAVTWDGSASAANVHIYVNGVEVPGYSIQTDGSGAYVSDSGMPLTIGATPRIDGRMFNGVLDDVRLYNQVLTPAQINQVMNNTAPGVTPVGHWALDESSGTNAPDTGSGGNDGTLTNFSGPLVLDSAGSNDGTPQGTITEFNPSGVHGGALDFDGTDGTVSIPENTAAIDIRGDISISAWVKRDAAMVHGDTESIVRKMEGANYLYFFYIQYWLSTYRLRFIPGGGGSANQANMPQFNDGQWYHLAVTYDAATDLVSFYHNGALIGTSTDAVAGGYAGAANSPLYIGSRNATDLFLDGTVDDVRVYNRALTEAEILEIYNADCTGPIGKEGTFHYDTDNNVMTYCDNHSWRPLAKLNPAAGGSGCISPAEPEGTILYNDDIHKPMFCDGDDWIVMGFGSENGCPVGEHGNGYFVITSETYTGDLEQEAIDDGLSPADGMDGADKLCLDNLTNNDWMGKTDAQARGILDAAHVQAFLCPSCRMPLPDTEYFFAVSGDATKGGASFTTNDTRQGPGNTANWSGTSYFDGVKSYWMNRGGGTNELFTHDTFNPNPCAVSGFWNEASGGEDDKVGITNDNDRSRWDDHQEVCSTSHHLICMVHP